MNDQEVEFTFEGDRRADLFLLQTRDVVVAPSAVVAAFIPGDELDAARVATGIGVGGGALSGRVAHRAVGRRASCAGVPRASRSSC